MSKKEDFKWDKWIDTAKFKDVILQRPIDHFARVVPTSICPTNRDILYLNSIDEWLDLNDSGHVISLLENIVRGYVQLNRFEKPFGLENLKLVQHECDFEALSVLANEIFRERNDIFDGKYENSIGDSKELFNEMVEKFKN